MPRSTLVFVAPERGFYSPRWYFRRHRYPWRSSLSDTMRARVRWCMLWYRKRIREEVQDVVWIERRSASE